MLQIRTQDQRGHSLFQQHVAGTRAHLEGCACVPSLTPSPAHTTDAETGPKSHAGIWAQEPVVLTRMAGAKPLWGFGGFFWPRGV